MDAATLQLYRQNFASIARTPGIHAVVWESDHRDVAGERMCFLLHDRAEILPPFSPLVLDDNQDHPHVQMAKVGFAIWNIEYRNLHQAKVVSNGDNSAPLPDLPKVEIQVGKQRGVVGLVEDKRQIKVFVLRERGHPTMKSFQRMVRRASKRIVKGDVP